MKKGGACFSLPAGRRAGHASTTLVFRPVLASFSLARTAPPLPDCSFLPRAEQQLPKIKREYSGPTCKTRHEFGVRPYLRGWRLEFLESKLPATEVCREPSM